MIFDRIVDIAPPGTIIPKPSARSPFRVKGLGKRRGEEALIYYVPNRKNPAKPYQKGITRSEFESAYSHLVEVGSFAKKWFDKSLSTCAAEGSCNFTTIGGLFQLLGEAVYQGRGIYLRE